MSDRLEELIRAARSPVERPSDDEIAERTRVRLLATARARSRKRIRLTTLLLPIAATFLATVAWAAAIGRLPALPSFFSGEPPVSTNASTQQAPSRGTAGPIASSSPLAVEAPAVESATTLPEVAPSASVPVASPSSTTAPSASAALEDPSEAMYREAHALHFRGGSPSAAVAAWDRYIAAAPRGRFVSEAQYNRALALLRSGRRAEGLAALRPFASGAYGSYRREEAKQILEAAERVGEK